MVALQSGSIESSRRPELRVDVTVMDVETATGDACVMWDLHDNSPLAAPLPLLLHEV